MVSEPGSGTAEFFPDSSVGKPEASDLGSAPASATTTYTGSPRNPFSTVTCTDGSRNLSTTRLGSSWNPLSTTLHREGSGSWNQPTIPGQDSPRNLSTTPGGSPRNPLPPKEHDDDAGSPQPKIGKFGKMPDVKINVESLFPMHIEADNMLRTKADVGYAPVEELCTMQKEAIQLKINEFILFQFFRMSNRMLARTSPNPGSTPYYACTFFFCFFLVCKVIKTSQTANQIH